MRTLGCKLLINPIYLLMNRRCFLLTNGSELTFDDIQCLVTDGDAVMNKTAHLIDVHQQKCYVIN